MLETPPPRRLRHGVAERHREHLIASLPGIPLRRRRHRIANAVPVIYVTGHRVPDTDSIGSAVGYAELKRRLDPSNEYVPVRLGDLNAQTGWVLERSGAPTPDFLASCDAAGARCHAQGLSGGSPS